MTAFEFPLNEKVRAYLRADELLRRITTLIAGASALEHHFALQTLFELQDMVSRSDIKGDLIRELERQRQVFSALRGNPEIDGERLELALSEIAAQHQTLSQLSGKPGQALGEIEWLNAVRGRINIAAGTCAFDLPAYDHWLRQTEAARREELCLLQGHFAPLQGGIDLLLRLIRQSAQSRLLRAPSGQLQYSVPTGRTLQLLRMQIDDADLVPEVTANRLVIVIRWLQVNDQHRLLACRRDVDFQLCVCSG